MVQPTTMALPLQGKTFSLHGDSANSDGYYEKIAELADAFLGEIADPRLLVAKVQALSKSSRRLKRLVRVGGNHPRDSFLVNTLKTELSPYTRGVQAHLYMLEIELVNRLFADGFKSSEKKLACIPELVRGMRLCMRFEVPVVGLPLDANRCARWWGEFRGNTVNFEKLAQLLQ